MVMNSNVLYFYGKSYFILPYSISMLSLYIHIPFCQKKCNYCSFTSFAGMQEAIPQYLEALEKEIDYYKEQLGDQEIKSIYFGGGTPTLI